MKKVLSIAVVGVVLVGGVALVSAHPKEQTVTLCHRTNSVTNPYVYIAIDASGLNGHENHTGPLVTTTAQAQALKDQHIKWGDIIPNIQNWTTEGQAIYNIGCNLVAADQPTPTPEPTPTPNPLPEVNFEGGK